MIIIYSNGLSNDYLVLLVVIWWNAQSDFRELKSNTKAVVMLNSQWGQ